MSKKNVEFITFPICRNGRWYTLKGERLEDFTNSESILALAASPYRCFVRVYDDTFSWELRKSSFGLRLILHRYA